MLSGVSTDAIPCYFVIQASRTQYWNMISAPTSMFLSSWIFDTTNEDLCWAIGYLSTSHCILIFAEYIFVMCRRRQVVNVYIRCGHTINLPEEVIRCEQPNCKFSLFHPPSCRPPACLRTCWQYLRYPEQYTPRINKYCPSCSQPI
ncbi:uncharacterized protein ARMOST_02266 [Armillaria ostoyae]|uniref:Uncharacterized protein n=1 Tax=Armillaria ostoyae TaxID=47428 RepID=A0A284QR95_ARMOS|nr:uncharacterized protein ARMOST_02266 [Armillaria ostoyae]